MSSQEKELHTIGDILALPDGVRAELLDGQIYYMATPSRKHQRIAGLLFWNITTHIMQKKCL